MSDQQTPVENGTEAHPAIHPVAPRLKNGSKIPHIGPHIHAYRKAHEETVGHESDKWWAKVRWLFQSHGPFLISHENPSLRRWRGRPFTGIAPSTQFVLVALRPVTSSGSQRAA